MADDSPFLDPHDGYYRFDVTDDNDVTVFYDNAEFFAAIRADLAKVRSPTQFVYWAGWWSDLRLPLGDPKARPAPPTFGAVLAQLAAGLPTPPPPDQSSLPQDRQAGPEICCLVWQHKKQWDWSATPAVVLPDSIFGAPILASINTATVKAVNALRGTNAAILDKRHAIFGCHHQKFTVMSSDAGLVGYVGSSDYNTDRLYAPRDPSAPVESAPGAPLDDVNVRITGPAAADLLRTFLQRWHAHPDAGSRSLIGDSYAPATSTPPKGSVQVQVSHTYAKRYPFSSAVTSAGDAQERICRTARRYVYYEDQYLIGTPGMLAALRAALSANLELVVIGVMAPLAVVSDLSWLARRRTDFWQALVDGFPGRVLLFEMLAPDGTTTGPGAYLHNKMTIADDLVVTVGSVNFSRRSHRHDSEIMVTMSGSPGVGPTRVEIAEQIRIARIARHLGVTVPAGSDGPEFTKVPGMIAALRRLPPTARITPWKPDTTKMTTEIWGLYTTAYDVALDPF